MMLLDFINVINNWRIARIIKLVTLQFSPASCYVLRSRSKYATSELRSHTLAIFFLPYKHCMCHNIWNHKYALSYDLTTSSLVDTYCRFRKKTRVLICGVENAVRMDAEVPSESR